MPNVDDIKSSINVLQTSNQSLVSLKSSKSIDFSSIDLKQTPLYKIELDGFTELAAFMNFLPEKDLI